MQKRQLYGTLQITNDEIRLLVGEYYMSRFNILKIETVKCNGIQNYQITKPELVTANIIKLTKSVEASLGFKLKSLILCIPNVDAKCLRRRVNVRTDEGSHKILKSQIRAGINTVIEQIDTDLIFINIGSLKYIVNGISYRNIPMDERCDIYTIDMDLLYADRDIVYSYVSCVERAGLDILDICLDSYAMAEESACIENSMDKYIVLVDFEKNDTILSLYNKGRLQELTNLKYGYGKWIEKLKYKYRLTEEECEKIICDNCFSDNGIYDDCISYIWTHKKEHFQITKKDIYGTVKDEVEKWKNEIDDLCKEIKKVSDCNVILCGAGGDIVGFESCLKQLSVPAEIYVPNTIGARNSKYTIMLGSLYCVKKMQELKNSSEVSVNFDSIVAADHHREDESAFTKKLKNILLNNK